MASSDKASPSDAPSPRPVKNGLPSVPPAEQELTLSRQVRRLNWGLLTEALFGFFSLETTFGRTLRAFLLRPRLAFEGYLGAQRLLYSNPVKLLITLTAVSTFLNYLIGNFENMVEGVSIGVVESNPDKALTNEQQVAFAQFLQRNYNLLVLGGLPIMALVTRLVYLKRAYNFVEHLALNSFLVSVSTTAQIILFIPTILFPDVVTTTYFVLSISYQTWAYRSICGPGWFRAISATILTTGLYFIVFSITIGLYLKYFIINE